MLLVRQSFGSKHTPSWQTSPVPQAVAQLPQYRTSVWVSTQRPKIGGQRSKGELQTQAWEVTLQISLAPVHCTSLSQPGRQTPVLGSQ